jgi:hypothetical protein
MISLNNVGLSPCRALPIIRSMPRSARARPRHSLPYVCRKWRTNRSPQSVRPVLPASRQLALPWVAGTDNKPDDFASLMDDLEVKIFGLPNETWFYLGHGKDSTLGNERPSIPEWRARGGSPSGRFHALNKPDPQIQRAFHLSGSALGIPPNDLPRFTNLVVASVTGHSKHVSSRV